MKIVPAVGGKTHLKYFQRFLLQLAVENIFTDGRIGRRFFQGDLQLPPVVIRGTAVDLSQGFPQALMFTASGVPVEFQGNSVTFRQEAYRFGKGHSFHMHDETDDVAVGIATKTVVAASLG